VREKCGTMDEDLHSAAKFVTVSVSYGSVDKFFYVLFYQFSVSIS
jgi:hypothetical protein